MGTVAAHNQGVLAASPRTPASARQDQRPDLWTHRRIIRVLQGSGTSFSQRCFQQNLSPPTWEHLPAASCLHPPVLVGAGPAEPSGPEDLDQAHHRPAAAGFPEVGEQRQESAAGDLQVCLHCSHPKGPSWSLSTWMLTWSTLQGSRLSSSTLPNMLGEEKTMTS